VVRDRVNPFVQCGIELRRDLVDPLLAGIAKQMLRLVDCVLQGVSIRDVAPTLLGRGETHNGPQCEGENFIQLQQCNEERDL
jgi:hypothetical protein